MKYAFANKINYLLFDEDTGCWNGNFFRLKLTKIIIKQGRPWAKSILQNTFWSQSYQLPIYLFLVLEMLWICTYNGPD